MHLTSGEAFMILAVLFCLMVGAVATVVNFVLILVYAVSKLPIRLLANIGWWIYYALPWLLIWTGLFHPLAAHFQGTPTARLDGPDIPTMPPMMILFIAYWLTVPFVAITQFVLLCRIGGKHLPKLLRLPA